MLRSSPYAHLKMMEFVNAAKNNTPDKQTSEDLSKSFLPMLRTGEEIWSLGQEQTYESWPVFDASALVEDTIQMVVMIQGKLRARA